MTVGLSIFVLTLALLCAALTVYAERLRAQRDDSRVAAEWWEACARFALEDSREARAALKVIK